MTHQQISVRELWARGIGSLAFVLATLVTLRMAFTMEGNMPMPGGWSMTMMWMVMPGQTIWSAALSFLLMWQAMMITMMLPSTWPVIELYQRVAVNTGALRPSLATFALAAGYFAVWFGFGCLSFAAGLTVSRWAMMSAQVSAWMPAGAGAGLIFAGAYQLTPFKQACLRHCRSPLFVLSADWKPGLAAAFEKGLHHGMYCMGCCWGLMLIQLILGVMNLGVMIAVAAVIGFEKLWKHGPLVARMTGVGALAAGAYFLVAAVRS